MKVIDENLGGTSPLDVIIKFKDDEPQVQIKESKEELDDFENEFNEKIEINNIGLVKIRWILIMAIHDYLELS